MMKLLTEEFIAEWKHRAAEMLDEQTPDILYFFHICFMVYLVSFVACLTAYLLHPIAAVWITVCWGMFVGLAYESFSKTYYSRKHSSPELEVVEEAPSHPDFNDFDPANVDPSKYYVTKDGRVVPIQVFLDKEEE